MLPNWLYGKSLRKLQEILNSGGQTAAGVSYSNTESGLEATNAQDAIDEIAEDLDTKAAQSTVSTLSDTVTSLTGVVNAKVDWVSNGILGAKNILAFDNIVTGESITTISNKGASINVKQAEAASWSRFEFKVDVEPNTDYILSTNIDYVSGKSRIAIRDKDNSANIYESSDMTEDTEFSQTFNTSTNDQIIIRFFCTANTSETGEVNYNNSMLRLATDTDNTYQYPAKTNAELTSDIDDLTTLESGEATGTVTFSQNKIYKRGNVVTVEIEFTADADYAAYANVITIPSTFTRNTGTMGYPYGVLINRSTNTAAYATLFGGGAVQFSAAITSGNVCRLIMTYFT